MEEVSAFAIYSGQGGTLSKAQRRRKNKAMKKSILTLSSEHDVSARMTKSNENKKKRKETSLSVGKSGQKYKKPKLNDSVNNILKEVEEEANSIDIFKTSPVTKSHKLKNKQKILNSAFTNGHLAEAPAISVSGKIRQVSLKVPLKKKKSKMQKMSNPKKLELFTEEEVKQKLSRNSEKNKVKKVKFQKVSGKKRKHINNFSTSQKEEEKVEDDQLQRQLNIPTDSATDLVGEVSLNQENKPTLISIINKVKKDVVSEETLDFTKPPLEIIMQQRNKISEKLRSSEDLGRELFEKIIFPSDSTVFFKNHWEKAPLYIPGNSTKFSSLISTQLIDDFLRQKVVMFGKHIDITSYKDGKRETHNPEGRALPHVVWDLYNHKCSVRLLCPQAAFNNVFVMNTKLQEYFGCFVGANSYLTPPNSQGFAPHYDDIEAFVLQIEGQKRWKIYNPGNKFETLPRYSSKNLTPSELGKPVMEVTLNPGDLLYFPRGFIHQADTGDLHSLHLTISVYQKNCWADLLEKALPLAVSKAAKMDLDFRRGLPLNFLRHAGLAYDAPLMRKALLKSLKQKVTTLLKYLDIDSAVDMMGVQFITDALPPVLTSEEAACCTSGNGLRMESNGRVTGSIAFTGDTKVRFTTALCHRLVREKAKTEDGAEVEEIRLYYTTDNSREYHGEEPQYLVIPDEYIPAIKLLSVNYPLYTSVKSLPLPSLNKQAGLVGDLWDRGILMTEEPLEEGEVLLESDDEVCSANAKDEDTEESDINSDEEDKITNTTEIEEKDVVNGSEKEQTEEDEEEISGVEITDSENSVNLRGYDKDLSDIDKFISINEEEIEVNISDDSLSTDSSDSGNSMENDNEENIILSDNEERDSEFISP